MFDAYIRVSQVGNRQGETFISPEVQKDQIEAWAASHQVVLGKTFCEFDESGSRGDRPFLMEAIARIEAGESEGLVVARLDRFGRSLLDGLAAIERIGAANGAFVSAQDGLDLRTDTGKLILRVMLSMAEWELDRIRSTWDSARERAINRGVHLGRTPPFGYQRAENGRLKLSPTTAPYLRELFERRARGASIRELGRWLEREGVCTSLGNKGWTDTTLRNILKNRVYLGELRSGKFCARGKHEPLVERGLWQRVQDARQFPSLRSRSPTLLGGILRCAGCRMALHSGGGTQRSGRWATSYSCGGRSGVGPCPSPAQVSGRLLEPLVEEAFFGAVAHRGRRRTDPFRGERSAVDLAERALDAYRDNVQVQLTLGEERYVAGLAARKRHLDECMRTLATQQSKVERLDLPSARELEDLWPTMSIFERREAIAKVIDCVFVWRGWGRVGERIYFCFRGHQPLNLPRPGVRHTDGMSLPFDPATDAAKSPTVYRPGRWPVARIEQKLNEFLTGAKVWPRLDEFLAAGYGPLYSQVLRQGGPRHWALRMSLDPPSGGARRPPWNETIARDTLVGFVRGRKVFPRRRDFVAAGFGGLYRWMERNRGVEAWAAELGIPRPRPGPRAAKS